MFCHLDTRKTYGLCCGAWGGSHEWPNVLDLFCLQDDIIPLERWFPYSLAGMAGMSLDILYLFVINGRYEMVGISLGIDLYARGTELEFGVSAY